MHSFHLFDVLHSVNLQLSVFREVSWYTSCILSLAFWLLMNFLYLSKKRSVEQVPSLVLSDVVLCLLLRVFQDDQDYAPGTQKNVSGEVIRWNNVSGLEKIDAVKYIELLEAEVEELNRQVGRKSANGQNELLEYLKSLEPQNLKVGKTV